MHHAHESKPWVVIFVALLGLIGVIFTGYISYNSGERAAVEQAIQATQSAEAKAATPTLVAHIDGTTEPTSLPTPMAPTATPTTMSFVSATLPIETPTDPATGNVAPPPTSAAEPTVAPIGLTYTITEADYPDRMLSMEVAKHVLICLTTGPISVANATPAIEFPGDGRASVVCWIGPQHAEATKLTGASRKDVTIISGDPEKVATQLVLQWAEEVTTDEDACGAHFGPCLATDPAIIRSDGTVIFPDLQNP